MSAALSEKILVRELAANYPSVIPVLKKYGIDYCCGGGHDLRTAGSDKVQ